MKALPMKIGGKGRACAPFILPLEMAAWTLRQVKVHKGSREQYKGCAADVLNMTGQTYHPVLITE